MLMIDSDRIKYLFSSLDLYKTLHTLGTLSSDPKDMEYTKRYNEYMKNKIQKIKEDVLKYGLEETSRRLMNERSEIVLL